MRFMTDHIVMMIAAYLTDQFIGRIVIPEPYRTHPELIEKFLHI